MGGGGGGGLKSINPASETEEVIGGEIGRGGDLDDPSTSPNPALNTIVHGGRGEGGGQGSINPSKMGRNGGGTEEESGSRWNVKCRISEDRKCTRHNTLLVRRKTKVRHWSVTRGGTARWSYRWEDNWHCSVSKFKALPNLPGGSQKC